MTMNTPSILVFCSAALLALAACSDPGSSEVSSAPPPAASAEDSMARFNTSATIRDVMNTLVDPQADALWNAVRFEVDENGAREMRPETDEDWLALRRQAIAIIEGGNSLMIPGRRVAPPGATTEFPEYEYLPDEVAAKLAENPGAWDGFAQGLQASALDMLQAIDNRDADLLSELGAALDEACESCHKLYWYRAENP
jgi:hypothetical protein